MNDPYTLLQRAEKAYMLELRKTYGPNARFYRYQDEYNTATDQLRLLRAYVDEAYERWRNGCNLENGTSA